MTAHLIVDDDPLKVPGVTRYWGAGAHVVQSADGSLFFAWAEKDGAPAPAALVRRFSDGRQVAIPLSPAPSSRPTLHAGPWGLLVCAGVDQDSTHLPYVWRVDDYQWPGGNGDQLAAQVEAQAARIAVLSNDVAALTQRIAMLGAGGGLDFDPHDPELLRRLRTFLLPLLGP